jgi:hypothetical protein
MRRITLLACAATALCAALALSATANAQSTTLGQLKSVVYGGEQAVTALPSGPTVRPADAADFRQHWDRDLVATNVFRFQRQGFNACLRVPDTVAANQIAAVAVASCSGTRAQWRRTFSPGTGDLYVNVATGHRMAPVLYFDNTVQDTIAAVPGSIAMNPPFLNWTFEAL